MPRVDGGTSICLVRPNRYFLRDAYLARHPLRMVRERVAFQGSSFMLDAVFHYWHWLLAGIPWIAGALMFVIRTDPEDIERNVSGWRLRAYRLRNWIAKQRWFRPLAIILVSLGGLVAGILLAPLVSIYATDNSPGNAGKIFNSAPPTPIIKSDVIRLLNTLPSLSALMERGVPLNKELAELLQRQPHLITISLSVADAKSQARALQEKFAVLRADFYAFYTNNSYDRDEITKIIAWGEQPRRRGEEYGVIVVDLGNYATELDRLPANATASDLFRTQNVWDFYVSLSEDQKRFSYWLTDTKARINTRRTELQEALKSAQ